MSRESLAYCFQRGDRVIYTRPNKRKIEGFVHHVSGGSVCIEYTTDTNERRFYWVNPTRIDRINWGREVKE